MSTNPKERKQQLENSLIGFRLKYLYEFYKVQLALVTGSIVILLGFYANLEEPISKSSIKISLFGLAVSTISQMLIYLQIYMKMHSVWYAKSGSEKAGFMFFFLFTLNLIGTITGLSFGYHFLISNI
ncbi:hypothetical protein KC992_01965 [Candidatus Saccharibacteria bacterium]|nr:hypothetical protein [Candidatus Saccharibacteria bacterium]